MKAFKNSKHEKEYIDLWQKIRCIEGEINKMEERLMRELNYLKKVINILENKIYQLENK